jgi:hypothetical protein
MALLAMGAESALESVIAAQFVANMEVLIRPKIILHKVANVAGVIYTGGTKVPSRS